MRTGNWLRTDTIFIENTQIEALSYRPPWAAAICEVGFTTGDPKQLQIDEDGITYNEQIISHAADVGVNYLSVWSWHNQSARSITSYYEKFPGPIDEMARQIGYRIRPSFIWTFKRDGANGLVIGLANDGITPVPGVLRLTVFSEDNKSQRVRLRRRRISEADWRSSSHADAARRRPMGGAAAES